jgi:hypothetical protein
VRVNLRTCRLGIEHTVKLKNIIINVAYELPFIYLDAWNKSINTGTCLFSAQCVSHMRI